MTRPRFQFSTVDRVPRSAWDSHSVLHGDHPPGTIFLFGDPGMSGGLMKLTKAGDFVTLPKEVVYLQELATWPESSTRFRLVGDSIEFVAGTRSSAQQ